jgi:dihydroflavonol-4-reductase
VKVFLTGGTGFIGGHVARVLRAGDDDVVALARSPSRDTALHGLGCEVVGGDVATLQSLPGEAADCDVVIHVAGVYRVGIPASERPAMYATNVTGTERVLDAAARAGVPRVVHVSTVNVFGNTRGRVVDESSVRPPGPFLSWYDETKFRAHEAALQRARDGLPLVIAMPGGTYGPGDHSEVGTVIDQVRTGKLKMRMFPELGFNLGHVEDVAAGIVRCADRGRVGECYVLGGQIARMGELVDIVARLVGRRPPRATLPVWAMRAATPAGPLVGRLMGYPPNLKEMIDAAAGVTYWATDRKARDELGYVSRGLDEGLRQTLAATGAAGAPG